MLYTFLKVFVCVEVLRPSQPNGVMSSAVSLPNHTFTGQALSSKRLTSIVHILSPETDNCPSWISGRERMTVENISWSISTKECCRPRRGLNSRPPGLQSDGASNWATEAGFLKVFSQTDISQQFRPRLNAQNTASHQGLHCLPLVQLFLDTTLGYKLY